MKKIGIITIIDKNNYGNRLQNYALYYFLKNRLKMEVYTLENETYYNTKKRFVLRNIKRILKNVLKKVTAKEENEQNLQRINNFLIFDKNIGYYNRKITVFSRLNRFDYLIVGSDQIWNPNFSRLSDIDVLKGVENNKRISYAASFRNRLFR